MGTKSQLIEYISTFFEESSGNPVSRSKLDSYRKADLENFIRNKGLESDFDNWLSIN